MASTKKTPAAKKVEAPIDQRETFVSLLKSFADSDMPVEEKLKTLYQLQAADSEIDKIIQLRGELPAEVAALEDEIANLKERSAAISAVIDQFGRDILMIPDGDGHFTTTVSVEVSPPFYAWVASFGRRAKILHPPAVVDGMKDFLQKASDMYKEEGNI